MLTFCLVFVDRPGQEGRCTLVFHVDSVCFISKLHGSAHTDSRRLACWAGASQLRHSRDHVAGLNIGDLWPDGNLQGRWGPCAAICVVRNQWNKHVVQSHSQQPSLPSPLKRESPYHLCNTEVLKREMGFTGFTSLKVYVETEKCWMGVGRTRGN